jgi:ABC-type sugar transport system substrate-binding protein
MRKFRLIAAVVLSLAAAAALAACGSGSGDAGSSGSTGETSAAAATPAVQFSSDDEKGAAKAYAQPAGSKALTIGFASPTQANEAVNTLSQAIKVVTESLGGKVVTLDAANSPDKQVSNIQQLIARRVDGIVVWPTDPKALDSALKSAKRAGIPVVGVEAYPDGRDPGEAYDSQIITRRDYMGYLQAKEMADRVGSGGKIAQIGFAVDVPSITYVVERAKYWAEKFGLTVQGKALNPSDDIAGGEKVGTELLAKYPDLKGIIAYNEESAIGAGAAARAQGKRDLALVGNNGGSAGFGAVESGRITATVQFAIPEIGKQAVWALYDLKAGDKVPRVVLGGTPKVVSKETLGDVARWTDQLKTLAK